MQVQHGLGGCGGCDSGGSLSCALGRLRSPPERLYVVVGGWSGGAGCATQH